MSPDPLVTPPVVSTPAPAPIPAPAPGEIAQPTGDLTPEMSWITGDTINLILAAFFYSETTKLISDLSNSLTDAKLRSEKTPFLVTQTKGYPSAIAEIEGENKSKDPENPETSEDLTKYADSEEKENEKVIRRDLELEEEFPESLEVTEAQEKNKTKDNYIFMIE